MKLLFLVALLIAAPARAEIYTVPYGDLLDRLDTRIGFETLPRKPEPGIRLDAPIRLPGIWIGEHFAGQIISGAPHDHLSVAAAKRPLRLRPGPKGQNLSVAYHRGFGSNALFPLGPDGFDAISGRGEGAVAILFDNPQPEIGFRLHSDYPAPLGATAPQGTVTVHFFNIKGQSLALQEFSPERGPVGHGFACSEGVACISGVVITNTDPGGIAMDDILFQQRRPLF
ncbi:hypothetical protein ACS3QZ_06040 [Shimia sp. W99]